MPASSLRDPWQSIRSRRERRRVRGGCVRWYGYTYRLPEHVGECANTGLPITREHVEGEWVEVDGDAAYSDYGCTVAIAPGSHGPHLWISRPGVTIGLTRKNQVN